MVSNTSERWGRGAPRSRALAVGLIAACTLLHLTYYFPRVVDDLFISLRYAENLANGRGAVYNLGERVEGYSSPLWMLLQTLGFCLGFEGVLFTKLLGVASLALLFLGMHRLARDGLGLGPWTSLLPLVSLAANSYLISWSILGLETPLYLAALIWTMVTLRGYDGPISRRTHVLATASMVALGLSRPESPIFLALIAVESVLVLPRESGLLSWTTSRSRLVARGPALIWACGILGACLLVRVVYYHDVVANTYYVKAVSSHFELGKLAALYTQSGGMFERVVVLSGMVLLGVFGAPRRRLAPFGVVVAVMIFTCSVEADWMPSLRHLLPVTVLAPLGVAALIDWLARPRSGSAILSLAVISLASMLSGALEVARLDHRLSPGEADGKSSRKPKTRAKWRDTLLAYQRIEPPHVSAMDTYSMGQITMAWGVLETSDASIASSWFAGRDIGALGYYTGVRVYDTAGLVTSEVSHAEPWQRDRRVTPEMVRRMMDRRPVAGEVYDGWDEALGREPELLDGYRIRFGPRDSPHGFIATDRLRPSRELRVARYEAFVRKFPRAFHLHTLYGESVGAAVERRYRIVLASP